MISLGENIRKYRERKRMSQTELAKLCNITPSMISQYESNGKVPNFILGVKLAKILGVSAEELIGRETA